MHDGRAYLVHDTGILTVLEREDRQADLQGPRRRRRTDVLGVAGRGGQPRLPAHGGGLTFVLDAGAEYKEIAKNDLGEMSLASPAIAGDALYIRTETKLYKIGG